MISKLTIDAVHAFESFLWSSTYKSKDVTKRKLESGLRFKGQTTLEINNLLKRNNCLVQQVSNNQTTIQIFVNHGTSQSTKVHKSFISEKYQDWYASKVTSQLGRGIEPHNMQVDIKLTTFKPIHTGWIMNFYKHMQSSGSLVKSWFRKVLVTEAPKEAEALMNLCQNQLQEIEIKTGA